MGTTKWWCTDAFLQDDDYFTDLLHYCNIMYEMLPTILMSSQFRAEKDARKLAAIAVVAAGFGGDMPEELANELLDDIDYHFNKVKCRKIEMYYVEEKKKIIADLAILVSIVVPWFWKGLIFMSML